MQIPDSSLFNLHFVSLRAIQNHNAVTTPKKGILIPWGHLILSHTGFSVYILSTQATRCRLGGCQKSRISGPTPVQLHQHLHFHGIPGDLYAGALFMHIYSESHFPHSCAFCKFPPLNTHTNKYYYYFCFPFQHFFMHIQANTKICIFPTFSHKSQLMITHC